MSKLKIILTMDKVYVWNDKAEGKPTIVPFSPEESKKAKTVIYKPCEQQVTRDGWQNKLDFLFSCISLSVGLGNVWRFPYLCYKHGGGVFLITYGIAMFFCGIPMFMQEVAIGQYLGTGGLTFVGQLCPILKGVGYASMVIVFLLDIYYCIVIAWTILYIIYTFSSLPGVPWSTCDNWWNTKQCFSPESILVNATNATVTLNSTGTNNTSSVEEFFERKILGITDGIENLGGMQWEIFGCLVIGWLTVYLIIRKGLHQSGKVIWFTALFPYFVLIILMIRAVTLEGAGTGLLFYVTPRWEELLTPGPWMEGATQIFFAYSIGCGALPALGSYNKFHHNCCKDALITCVINTLTSILAGVVTFAILGHLASETHTDVANVVQAGPGLVFLTYPQVVLRLPGAPFWAACFFFVLVLLGINSEFCLVESLICGMVDNWPQQLRPYRTTLTTVVCMVMFLLGVPMVTKGGMYVFQLMDYYSASGMSLLWVCFFQTVALSWIFGVEKLYDCIEKMIGYRPSRFWGFCWKYCAPVVMLVIFVSQCVQFKRLTYGDFYHYPLWADIIGYILSISSMIWVPAYAIYYVLKEPGTILENLRNGIKPQIKERKLSMVIKQEFVVSESNVGLLTSNCSFALPES